MKQILHIQLALLILTAYWACTKDVVPTGASKNLTATAVADNHGATKPENTADSGFYFGVNGHPLTQDAYKDLSAREQIQLIKSLGMNIYRIDVTVYDNGAMKMHDRYLEFKRAAYRAGVTLLPMLYPDLSFDVTEEVSYQKGFARGRNFAERYKDDFVYYNLGNELDKKCILHNYAGNWAGHYDPVKFKVVAAQLKGMNDGVKSVDPDAQTMINAGWMHYQYLLMLEQYGINFDIIAYHWYDEMEALAYATYKITDITRFLSTKFSKPIWFTEVNVRDHKGTVPEETQRNYLNLIISKCHNNPQVKAVMVYELFKQPVFRNIESHYGIYRWITEYTEYIPKLWAREQY